MTNEDLREIDASSISIAKFIHIISKNQILYLNHRLEDTNINVSQLHFLFEIANNKNINQEKIASRCNFDKGAVARSIKKLEEKGLVKRQIDTENRRQNIVSLTSEGEKALSESVELLEAWENEVYDIDIIDREVFKNILKEMAINSIEINQKGE
ncbi:MarR family winged helix-turn-helix transcriptional regulator [Methanobrevibacter sp.]|uniref:MarR family winged helix-turn-helix transcriptional regulator n=1 Tax=Methanobrevibacter sp. TaxID=66852 RepID=UPI00386AFBAA